MTYIYTINGRDAELIKQTETFDKIHTQSTYPAREYHENTHAVLSYNTETESVYWEYIPYTPAEMREQAYRTERCIEWGDDMLTVDEANKLWMEYKAEDSVTASELTSLIATAKESIRALYPDAES